MASVLSIAAFDYGFVPPFYTFNVHNTAFFLTFAVMLVVAMGMSELTGRIREQAEEASEGEQLAAAQYTLSRELAAASGLDEEVEIATRHISEAGQGEALILVSDRLDQPTSEDMTRSTAWLCESPPGWPSSGEKVPAGERHTEPMRKHWSCRSRAPSGSWAS